MLCHVALASRRCAAKRCVHRCLPRHVSSSTAATDSESWEVCIGLEVHAQILAATKLFSGASADTAAATLSGPNSAVSLFDAALPGTLPSPNLRCVEAAVLTGAAMSCDIHPRSVFERKHYFYPDLPLGYQITQLRHPIASDGRVRLTVPRSWKRTKGSVMDVYQRWVGITRIQLEQDSGKSNHTLSRAATLVDLNRAGVGLLEIVTEPDLRSAAEAGEFLRVLQRLLRQLGTCDGNMEEGSMRCDVNVSVRPTGSSTFGQRVEMKNLNSIKSVMRAIEYEAGRQVGVLTRSAGHDDDATPAVIDGETRSFDAVSGTTSRLRSKEDAPDYRFFPDPDLPPVVLSQTFISDLSTSIPELPWDMQDRLVSELGLPPYDAAVVVGEVGATEYLEDVLRHQHTPSPSPKAACNWIVNECFGRLKDAGVPFSDMPVSAASLAELLDLVASDTISTKAAKDVLALLFDGSPDSPKDIVDTRGWALLKDEAVIGELVDQAVADPANAKLITKLLGGSSRVSGAFVGKVIAASGGRADPPTVNKLVKAALDRVVKNKDEDTRDR